MNYPGGAVPPGPGYIPQPRIRFEAIGEAWRLFQQQMGTWIGATFVYFVLAGGISWGFSFLTGLVTGGAREPASGAEIAQYAGTMLGVGLVTNVISIMVSVMLMAGLYRMAIRQLQGQTIAIGDMFTVTDVFGPVVIASLLMTLFNCIGFALCIIPGMVFSALMMLTIPLVVDQNKSPMDAIRMSWNALSREWLMATLFYIVVAIVGAIGAVACGFGILFTYPVFILAVAIHYRDYFLLQQPSQPPFTPADPSTPPTV